jgi:error-prone DNA polymerase
VVAAADRPAQLMLDLDDAPALTPATGLPEMSNVERVHAELDILGLDVSAHVIAPYAPMLNALGAVRAADVRGVRSRSEIDVAGVKVATQTPPVRSGRRVVFLTLDDSSGPVDATFFEDVQGPYAATVFHSWMLLVRGVVRRTGPQGVSLRATGAWELSGLWDAWAIGGLDAVLAAVAQADAQARALVEAGRSYDAAVLAGAVTGAAASRSSRPVMSPVAPPEDSRDGSSGGSRDGSGAHRVLVHPSGYRQSPYADVRPPGEDTKDGRRLVAPRKLWHSSPGSSGH